MKRKSISLIIGLMSVALLGVMAMQYYFIRESYQLKSQLFDQSVNEALNAVVSKLEKRDAMLFLKRKAEERIKFEQAQKSLKPTQLPQESSSLYQKEYFAQQLKLQQQKIDKDFKLRDSLLRLRYPKALVINSDFYETYFKDPNEWSKVRFQVNIRQNIDPYGRVFQDKYIDLYAEDPEWRRKLKKSTSDSVHYLVEDPMSGFHVVSLPKVNPKLKLDLKKEEDKKQAKRVSQYLDSVKFLKQKTAIFEDLANEYEQVNIPLQKRVNPKIIEELLQKELLNRGIDLPYNYQVTSNYDSVIYTKVSIQYNEVNRNSTYKTSLFPKEMVRETGILTVTFPGKPSMMFKNMDVILASSAGLLLVLIGCFTYTILIIFRQKKISEMKTDFINNMTHEFKTPVATIMIASEALKDPEVTEDKNRIDRLAKIIYDENIRLGNHIERVLNVAKIDKGDLKLEESEVEMNDLILAVVDSMSLQLQKREAIINLNLAATQSVIKGDELHLSNVLFNLLDNAVKYSKEVPEININTCNVGKNFVVKVCDKGIGMSKDQLSRIFDQFYRIPTGNLHDVKGFGLGLSYVNNIVKRLQGTIKVKSEKDKGSQFEISFPAL